MYTMKGRDHGGKGPPAADLLVCFPSKAHLRLMPKPICSPSRPLEPTTRHHQHRHIHHLRKSSRGGHSSPLFSAKTKAHHHHHRQNQNSDISSEPTSPKVTCAGQIKVRKPASSCKNWQSVMEEIERMHNNRKQKKKSAWIEALGFKKEVMQFLTCLRNVRFDFRCFGSFPTAEITSDDDDDEDDDEDEDEDGDESTYRKSEDDRNSRDVFSKWFMILQENNQEERKEKVIRPCSADGNNDDDGTSGPPPANALLLMRCRSAPAKSWLEEKQEEEQEEEMEKIKEKERKEEEEISKQSLVVMRCGADYSKLSNDIAKETWVVGGIKELLSRSRSCKR